MTRLKIFLALAFLVVFGFSAWLILNHLNILQIDLVGHLASAVSFQRGYYHQFNDQIFLGYIHGLFYPPLEDLILSVLVGLFQNPLQAFKFYLVLICGGYLASGWFFLRNLKSTFATLLFSFGFIFIFLMEKQDLMYFQGLSFVEIWRTGLTSQILGGIFLFPLISELRKRKSSVLVLGGSIFFAITSHLLAGIVAVLLTVFAVFLKTESRMNQMIALGGALFASGFFWIPFVLHRPLMTSATVLGGDVVPFFTLGAAFLFFGWKNPSAKLMLLVSVFLFGVQVVVEWAQFFHFAIPVFHYYRLSIYGLLLLLMGASFAVENPTFLRSARASTAVIGISLVVCFWIHFKMQKYDLTLPSLSPSTVILDDATHFPNFSDYGRVWSVENERTVDFSLDSWLAIRFPEYRSVKGLYWESSRENTMISSFLATLLSPPVVLDHYAWQGQNCAAESCLLDQWFELFNIKGWIIDPRMGMSYLSGDRKKCLQDILKRGHTDGFDFTARTKVSAGKSNYQFYEVTPIVSKKVGSSLNSAAEWVSPEMLKSIARRGAALNHEQAMETLFQSCARKMRHTQSLRASTNGYVFSDEATVSKVKGFALLKTSGTPIGFKKVGPGEFELEAPSVTPGLIWIKLAYFPEWQISDESGKALPLWEALPGMLTYGRGKLRLKYLGVSYGL